MKRLLLTIALAAVLPHGNMPFAAAQLPDARRPDSRGTDSRQKVILLDNGYVLRGQLIDEGDQVLIRLGPGSQLRLPRGRIRAAAASIDALYHIRHRQLHRDDAAGRIELARWCLSNDLNSRAGELLVELLAIAPRDPQVAALERRLRQTIAVAKPAASVQASHETPVQTVAWQQVEAEQSVLDQITPEELVEFTQHVQPALLNHCSASGCHGIASKSAYKILRPFHGQQLTQRMTSRNLETSLAYVNLEQPLESKLFAAATGAHFGEDWPIPAGARGDRTRATLKRWLLSLQTGSGTVAATAAPNEISDEASASLLQQGPRRSTSPPVDSTIANDSLAPLEPTPTPVATTTDPFDPDVFNRHFFPERFKKSDPFDPVSTTTD